MNMPMPANGANGVASPHIPQRPTPNGIPTPGTPRNPSRWVVQSPSENQGSKILMNSLYAKLCVGMAVLIMFSLGTKLIVAPKYEAVLNKIALNEYKLSLIDNASASVNSVDKATLTDTLKKLSNTVLSDDDELTLIITNFLKRDVFTPNHVQYPNSVNISQTKDELVSTITFISPLDNGLAITQELEKRLWVKDWGLAPVTISDQATGAPVGGQDLFTFNISLRISLRNK